MFFFTLLFALLLAPACFAQDFNQMSNDELNGYIVSNGVALLPQDKMKAAYLSFNEMIPNSKNFDAATLESVAEKYCEEQYAADLAELVDLNSLLTMRERLDLAEILSNPDYRAASKIVDDPTLTVALASQLQNAIVLGTPVEPTCPEDFYKEFQNFCEAAQMDEVLSLLTQMVFAGKISDESDLDEAKARVRKAYYPLFADAAYEKGLTVRQLKVLTEVNSFPPFRKLNSSVTQLFSDPEKTITALVENYLNYAKSRLGVQ